MDNLFLQTIKTKVDAWRDADYPNVEKETLNILKHIRKVGFLYTPQMEAFETYIYLKEVVKNKPTVDIFKSLFDKKADLLLALGLSKSEAFDYLEEPEKIDALLQEKFGDADYANQVYALTMGAGKTILMAVIMVYDFVLSFYHKNDDRFARNALVFAPDKTIIESLKEIKSFDYSKILPKEYENILLNVKYYYLEDTETPLAPIGNYNVIVSNSQKIILKTKNLTNNIKQGLFQDVKHLGKVEAENARLLAIRKLDGLAVFVDEAHHSYGKDLEGNLKKIKQTIEYLHKNTPITNVINLTGTPYVKNKMIADVVYHYGLKEGIERGILKQVRFYDYSNTKDDNFIQNIVETFWTEYGENRLEGKLPKIAFYSASIDDLRENLRPKLEKTLKEQNISLDKVLEYHTEAEDNKDDFVELDTEESNKQFILLVGKGTEGWNCRSLVATALFRKPKSSIFVLQSSTRCLRSIGDNSTIARIFLSTDNYKILDKELKNNFATDIEELQGKEQEQVEHELKIERKKKLKVNKILKEIISVKRKDTDKIKIDFRKFNTEKHQAFIAEGGIFLKEGIAGYQKTQATKKLEQKENLTFYEIVEVINRYTHLPCVDVEAILENNKFSRKDIVKKVNDNIGVLSFITDSILDNAYKYEEKKEIIEEELELTKLYPFKITREKGHDGLIVYREDANKKWGQSRIGFHINPYNFDSGDEKDLFQYLRGVLDENETVVDVYFTGGVNDPSHNEFYFEYYNPDEKRLAKYFPDFLVETTKGRYLVIEVKGGNQKEGYEKNKKTYKGNIKDIFNTVFAKELGFKEFQVENKNFEYRIVFDANLQARQHEIFEKIKKI
ncbi:DEAD/DEAH box helicase [Methanoculleus sp.]|uniref:DEAD/DEAH box helicase n=1 Tax=Methanoculleus sp. TaxID=90427 RepID=UPI0025DF4AD8|nr:DEAD/DEAH box helicase family protein [Methanoculleus sp.]MCK9319221.1 DEAD/DEAH box helicase family protein [Methanoculleus sp.]